jgi:ABC transport system ATP-binding/permease protein
MTDAHPRPAKTIRIGRQPDNDIALTENLEVSRHHAELRCNPDGSFEIIDLGSHGGTYVNGERITRKQLTAPISGSTWKASPTTGTSPCSG